MLLWRKTATRTDGCPLWHLLLFKIPACGGKDMINEEDTHETDRDTGYPISPKVYT